MPISFHVSSIFSSFVTKLYMGGLTAWSKIIPSRQQKFLHERAKNCGATIVVGQSKRKALESGGSQRARK